MVMIMKILIHYLIKNILDSIKDTDIKLDVLKAIKEYYTE